MINNPKANDFTTSKQQPTITVVATTTLDGGSNPSIERPRRKLVSKQEDAFLYYSHQETRMNTLLMNDDESDERAVQESEVRKTIISYELHPPLLLDPLLLQDDHR